jgi:hypothetical protein
MDRRPAGDRLIQQAICELIAGTASSGSMSIIRDLAIWLTSAAVGKYPNVSAPAHRT